MLTSKSIQNLKITVEISTGKNITKLSASASPVQHQLNYLYPPVGVEPPKEFGLKVLVGNDRAATCVRCSLLYRIDPGPPSPLVPTSNFY